MPEKALYLRLLALYPELEDALFALAQTRHSKKALADRLDSTGTQSSLLAELHLQAQGQGSRLLAAALHRTRFHGWGLGACETG